MLVMQLKTFEQFNEALLDFATGGASGGLTLEEIALKHVYDDSSDSQDQEKYEKILSDLRKQLELGKLVEKERADDVVEVEKIVKDHLVEDPEYYTYLVKRGIAKKEVVDMYNKLYNR